MLPIKFNRILKRNLNLNIQSFFFLLYMSHYQDLHSLAQCFTIKLLIRDRRYNLKLQNEIKGELLIKKNGK